jgi:hypothetical protein
MLKNIKAIVKIKDTDTVNSITGSFKDQITGADLKRDWQTLINIYPTYYVNADELNYAANSIARINQTEGNKSKAVISKSGGITIIGKAKKEVKAKPKPKSTLSPAKAKKITKAEENLKKANDELTELKDLEVEGYDDAQKAFDEAEVNLVNATDKNEGVDEAKELVAKAKEVLSPLQKEYDDLSNDIAKAETKVNKAKEALEKLK